MGGIGPGFSFQQGQQAVPVLTDQGQHPGRRFTFTGQSKAAGAKGQTIARSLHLCQGFTRRHRSTVKASPETALKGVWSLGSAVLLLLFLLFLLPVMPF